MKTDRPALLALFLTERTGSCIKTWSGRMPAAQQRALFGVYLGKGRLWIDGAAETVEHHVSVCFGLDTECTARLSWRDLDGHGMPSDEQYLAALGPCDK